MDENQVLKNAFSMPLTCPLYPPGPYIFIDREFFIITYETDLDILRQVVPKPLEVLEPIVKFEFIRMPNCTGFGDYTESGQVIPVSYKGQKGSYIHSMYLDVLAPVAAGREIWGFPKKIGKPALDVYKNILSGTLDFGRVRIATGTMGFKYQTLDFDSCHKALTAPNFLLKIIPDVDGSPKICELVRCQLEVKIKGAWTGPCSLQLFSHALAPVSDLPIKKILSGSHILTDVVLPYGEVVYDYLKNRGKK